jgi:membrane fusion protein (multidrug efflux system)
MDAFAKTFARLQADRHGPTLWTIAAAVVVFVAWMCWAAQAQIALVEVSSEARIELDSATFAIQSPVLGRVAATALHVGQEVHRGDVLVEIDSTAEQLQVRQLEARQQGLEPQLARLRAQIAAELSARGEEQRGAGISGQEAGARLHEAEIAAQNADRELIRTRKLRGNNFISERELERAETEATRLRAAVATLEAAARRTPQQQTTLDRERDVRLERLRGEIATLETQREALRAECATLGYEIERRRIRAPGDGRVGEAATLRAGAVIDELEKLGAIVPSGQLHVVAQYPAPAAFGRIRAGQAARLRLDGFPWAEFGPVSATVSRVAEEVRDGKVRVELTVDAPSNFSGKLEHGMPGSLEVDVERVTPLSLILRTAGQWLTARL